MLQRALRGGVQSASGAVAARRKLRIGLMLFALALAVPIAILAAALYARLEVEARTRLEKDAETFVQDVDKRLSVLLAKEEERPFEHYSFISLASNPLLSNQNTLNYSPLSVVESSDAFPGAIGYFQINPDGTWQTPLLPDLRKGNPLPDSASLGNAELKQRTELKNKLQDMLVQNGFLRSGRFAQRRLTKSNYGKKTQVAIVNQSLQQNFLEPETEIETFEGEIDPLQVTLLSNGAFAVFRKVWRKQQRYVQGFVVPPTAFLDALIGQSFRTSALSQQTVLKANYNDTPIGLYGELSGMTEIESGSSVLTVRRLSSPLSELELRFFTGEISAGSAARAVDSLVFALVVVLCLGLWGIYRLGSEHIKLAEERSNFVSAISHELKTPLTSIRMYGEMLSQGWVRDEQRRQNYYEFIFYESERLSRLVSNVLKLAQFNKGQVEVSFRTRSAEELMEMLAAKVRAQLVSAGFALQTSFEPPETGAQQLRVDEDLLSQIIINFVDNALKFSKNSEEQSVLLGCRLEGEQVAIYVRDFGPGIAPDKMGKIFQLFYRGEDELKRKTPGTGIGLALVFELAKAMHADVRAINRSPGAEFQVVFDSVG